ncbi:MAG TPA: tetratricopeptide repeat protein [Candidatus Eremiobacteraceae bacterium]|nr:tetratricopeptide repeat protein [Candidatus Eremiobacteraceae bacterium]
MPVYRGALAVALYCLLWTLLGAAQQSAYDEAQAAYNRGDYSKAVEILKAAAQQQPDNGQIQLLLTKCYLESNHIEDAVKSAEKAVSTDPRNSDYHRWLGEAYGEKADHAGMLSAYSWARKTQKEFETAVQLDEHNYDAYQDLIEYDCTAPSIVGGGEDKAQPLIRKLTSMDAAEGHFAQGVCRAVKKDYPTADTEYAKARENRPKTADRLYDIADYFQQRGNGDRLLEVADSGEALAPKDPRGLYYQAVGFILKGQRYTDAEKLLRQYLAIGPLRSTYPGPAEAHYWLGRLYAAQNNTDGARNEYKEALKLNPKYKRAEEALKRLG